MKIGFARVSAKWYQSEVQIKELENLGCDKIWTESSIDSEDPNQAFKDFLIQVSKGDTVITTRLTSVAQSTPDLLDLLEQIHKKGAFFRSLAEPWADTKVVGGERVIETLRGIVDFEIAVADAESRDQENRPKAFGMAAGRPQKLTAHQKSEAISLLSIGKTAAEISRIFGVSRSTISRLRKNRRQ